MYCTPLSIYSTGFLTSWLHQLGVKLYKGLASFVQTTRRGGRNPTCHVRHIIIRCKDDPRSDLIGQAASSRIRMLRVSRTLNLPFPAHLTQRKRKRKREDVDEGEGASNAIVSPLGA